MTPMRSRVHRFPKLTVAAYICLAMACALVLIHASHREVQIAPAEERYVWLFLVAGLLLLMPRIMSPLLAKALDAWRARKSGSDDVGRT